MAVYLNSTVGILATLYKVNPKKLVYPNMPLDRMRNIPVPHLNDEQVATLSKTYHRFAHLPLLRLQQTNDTVRSSLDETLCLTMGWNQETVQKARFALAEEPAITGHPTAEPQNPRDRLCTDRASRSRPNPALFQTR